MTYKPVHSNNNSKWAKISEGIVQRKVAKTKNRDEGL